VHVAASLFHDIAPAKELGLKTVWINRETRTRRVEPKPDRELIDLSELPDTLDELVPAE
jgi:2-haloacid dehalogenase